ncbi:MAG: RNA methyltransferase [Candidatus Omnitrophica bacterium]|nr:RNA methyltransferase [Candidatus Omnitrophota bacterium]
MIIASFSNPKIKELAKLRDHRERVKTGLTLIEGIREVRAAINAGISIKEMYICPSLYEGHEQGHVEDEILKGLVARKVDIVEVTKEVFAKVSFGDRSEGVLAIGSARALAIKDVELKKNPIFMLVEGVEKPGNLGAILRTCDAAGVDALFVCDAATDIFNPNVIRASLGTVFTVPVINATTEQVVEFFKSKNIKIVAATPAGKKSYTSVNLCGGIVIAVGSEKDGLSATFLKAAEEKVFIPMKGRADSLNTSVAAALLAYEALRQRS